MIKPLIFNFQEKLSSKLPKRPRTAEPEKSDEVTDFLRVQGCLAVAGTDRPPHSDVIGIFDVRTVNDGVLHGKKALFSGLPLVGPVHWLCRAH